jgi:hypothetical protein
LQSINSKSNRIKNEEFAELSNQKANARLTLQTAEKDENEKWILIYDRLWKNSVGLHKTKSSNSMRDFSPKG